MRMVGNACNVKKVYDLLQILLTSHLVYAATYPYGINEEAHKGDYKRATNHTP